MSGAGEGLKKGLSPFTQKCSLDRSPLFLSAMPLLVFAVYSFPNFNSTKLMENQG